MVLHVDSPSRPAPQRRRTRDAARPWLLRAAVAVVGGLALYTASAPRDLWWLTPIGLALLTGVTTHRRLRAGFAFGLLFGLAYLLPLLSWLWDFLGPQYGPWPWLALSLVEAAYLGVAGAGMALVSRLPAAPVWLAAVFVTVEELRCHTPMGGFAWGTLADTQAGGPYLPLAGAGGGVLVGFAVALTGSAAGLLALRILGQRRRGGRIGWRGPLVCGLVPLVLGPVVAPLLTTSPSGTARVALVQGNTPASGLNLLHEQQALHNYQVHTARRLVEAVRSGKAPRPDVVVLPESTSTWGPQRVDPDLDRLTAELGVPVIVGGTAESSSGQLSNRAVRWDPTQGPTNEYVKRKLVPFAEYMPLRALASLVTPFANTSVDMVPGHAPGVFAAGPARVGVALCYDIAYPRVAREATAAGATMLAVPTNNAWFGPTEMTDQQLAAARVRAVTNGRAVAVAANSGVSALVQPDGAVTTRSGQYTPDILDVTVPLRTGLTPATRIGATPELAAAALAVAGLAWAVWPRLRRRARGRAAS